MNLQIPVNFEGQVYITNGDQSAKVTYKMPRGVYPTKQSIDEAISAAIEEARQQVGEDWRLMTKREYFDELMEETTGTTQKFALPGGEDWDQ